LDALKNSFVILTIMTDLSPAAQAVLDGFRAVPTLMDGPSIAGALRAIADQVVPEHANPVGDEHDDARYDQWMRIRAQLFAIADELEGQ
jgi:hypothetical protein